MWSLESALAIDHTLPGKGVGVETRGGVAARSSAIRAVRHRQAVPPLGVWEDTSMVSSLYDGKTLIWP